MTEPTADNSAAPFIAIEGLRKSFALGGAVVHALAGVDLTIDAGTFHTIMGPSGSGKSTLTKLLQGFLSPTTGQVLVDGRDTRHMAANELRATFGVVPQETVLFAGTLYESEPSGELQWRLT